MCTVSYEAKSLSPCVIFFLTWLSLSDLDPTHVVIYMFYLCVAFWTRYLPLHSFCCITLFVCFQYQSININQSVFSMCITIQVWSQITTYTKGIGEYFCLAVWCYIKHIMEYYFIVLFPLCRSTTIVSGNTAISGFILLWLCFLYMAFIHMQPCYFSHYIWSTQPTMCCNFLPLLCDIFLLQHFYIYTFYWHFSFWWTTYTREIVVNVK